MKLKITQCNDFQMWYHGKIGQTFPLIKEETDVYWSREDTGHLNIVKKSDAVIEDETEAQNQ